MNTPGLIGIAATYLNYRSAKNEYDALVEKRDGLVAAIQTYNETKYDDYAQSLSTRQNMPDGVLVTTTLRVANLVGKNVFRAQPSVVLTNTSDRRYYIKSVEATCLFKKMPITIFAHLLNSEQAQTVANVDAYLEPGQTMEIVLPKGYAVLPEDGLKDMRAVICERSGKKIITSCPKISLTDADETADIAINWSENNTSNKGITLGKHGVLRYCGEAGL